MEALKFLFGLWLFVFVMTAFIVEVMRAEREARKDERRKLNKRRDE